MFRVGDYVKYRTKCKYFCRQEELLIIGKSYRVIYVFHDGGVYIETDFGFNWFDGYMFEKDKRRKEKIKKICLE